MSARLAMIGGKGKLAGELLGTGRGGFRFPMVGCRLQWDFINGADLAFQSKSTTLIKMIKRAVQFANLRASWLGAGGMPVPPEQAQARADVCLKCPHNVEKPIYEIFTGAVARSIAACPHLKRNATPHNPRPGDAVRHVGDDEIMHDPLTLAFEIKWPFKNKNGWRQSLISIWHHDPENGPGGDDSCGWFKRAHHGDPEVLAKIIKRFEKDWDRTWTYDPREDCEAEDAVKTTYPCGYFFPNGMPRLSVHGIVLNLFLIAANEHFKCDGLTNWKKSKSFMRKHQFDILLFAENTVDSLMDSITRKFGNNDGSDRQRNERIRHMAEIIYGWILRAEQKWWQHPRWHVHHWEFQCHPLQALKRFAFSRCCKCGKGFRWNASVTTNSWNGTGPLWFRSEKNVYHDSCDLLSSEPVAQKP